MNGHEPCEGVYVLDMEHAGAAASPNLFCPFLPFTFQGKYEEAEPLYRRSLAIDEKVYGPDHPEVATDLNNWAVLLEKQVRKQTMLVEECFLRNSTCQSD